MRGRKKGKEREGRSFCSHLLVATSKANLPVCVSDSGDQCLWISQTIHCLWSPFVAWEKRYSG